MGDTTPTSRPALAWGVSTDAGRVREGNEDSFVAEPMVLGIADGMGGHQAGEVASRLAVDILRERLSGGARNVDVVVAAVVEANVSIFQSAHANASQRGMGTTLTAIALLRDEFDDDDEYGSDARELVLVNVGDSRAYVHRNGLLRRASIDHSYVQELVATGHITEAEARTHPRRNIVTRALGIEPNVRVDMWRLPLVRGDRYVLCSDGLVDEADDGEIEALLNRIDDPQEAADELVALANHNGGRDNVTVIVADVLVGAEPPAGPAAAPVYAAEDFDAIEVDPEDDTGTNVDASGVSTDSVNGVGEGGDHTGAILLITSTAGAGSGPDTTSAPRRRKMTLGMFLFLLALAAIITVTVVLLAVAVGNSDDGPNPTVPATTVTSTSVATSTTAAPTSTTSPTTTVAVATTVSTASTALVTTSSAG